MRTRHYSPRTEEAYCGWIRRYIRFHDRRHPDTLGPEAVERFLEHLAAQRVSASTQNQALAALLFLYAQVLLQPIEVAGEVVRAKRPHRIPVVLTITEVVALIERMNGVPRLMASILYGSGLRLLECAELRVKDLDLDRCELRIRDGKGRKDRVTTLPRRMVEPLRDHLAEVQSNHRRDLALGAGWVALPDALDRKYPNAGREWPWQWVFPATRTYLERETGVQCQDIADRSMPRHG